MQDTRDVQGSLLVVDDNPDDIEILKIALESIDRNILLYEALDGETAIRMLRDEHCRPNLILLDLKMPGMSGFDVLRIIRSEEKLKYLPVVICSSSALERDKSEAESAGANGYIGKNFDFKTFCDDLETVIIRWFGPLSEIPRGRSQDCSAVCITQPRE